LVKAEYRYFKSFSKAALAFSDLDSESLEPRPKDDQKALMDDTTLRMLDTECMESLSDFGRCGLFRKETYADEASVLIFSRRMFMGPIGTSNSSKRDRR
jgi:hypothetical protein